mmetsp:Transcript_108594/g.188600  ORF Transcript_108594/g.188600 Transcript_108594/m.188600 type:complete len:185 (-) Transcript_108594:18-572(-)
MAAYKAFFHVLASSLLVILASAWKKPDWQCTAESTQWPEKKCTNADVFLNPPPECTSFMSDATTCASTNCMMMKILQHIDCDIKCELAACADKQMQKLHPDCSDWIGKQHLPGCAASLAEPAHAAPVKEEHNKNDGVARQALSSNGMLYALSFVCGAAGMSLITCFIRMGCRKRRSQVSEPLIA